MSKRRFMVAGLCLLLFASATAVFVLNRRDAASTAPNATSTPPAEISSPRAEPQAAPATAFDKQKLSTDDPASPWVVANKQRALRPKTYAPDTAAPSMALRLSAQAAEMQVSKLVIGDLQRLADAAKTAGLPLMLASGYRSYDTQVSVYGNEVRAYGQTQADRQSARPGHSEHQTGLAIDLAPASGKCMIAECFGELPEGKWLAAHAHEYGFIIRYPQGKESTTGYLYEPWHLRYVGSELAQELHKQGNPTLEEFFGLPAAPNY